MSVNDIIANQFPISFKQNIVGINVNSHRRRVMRTRDEYRKQKKFRKRALRYKGFRLREDKSALTEKIVMNRRLLPSIPARQKWSLTKRKRYFSRFFKLGGW